jgi:hypothetical protein
MVEQDGRTFDEIHVDGGVARQVFIFPTQFYSAYARQGTQTLAHIEAFHHPQRTSTPNGK